MHAWSQKIKLRYVHIGLSDMGIAVALIFKIGIHEHEQRRERGQVILSK